MAQLILPAPNRLDQISQMTPADGIGTSPTSVCTQRRTYLSNRAVYNSVEMPFIISDGIGSTETDKRKLIRRYVMLGKNRGKTRKMKRVDHQPAPSDLEGSKNGEGVSTGLSINMRYSHIPQKVGSELSFTQFADSVEPALIKDILKCNYHPVSAFARPKSALLMLASIA